MRRSRLTSVAAFCAFVLLVASCASTAEQPSPPAALAGTDPVTALDQPASDPTSAPVVEREQATSQPPAQEADPPAAIEPTTPPVLTPDGQVDNDTAATTATVDEASLSDEPSCSALDVASATTAGPADGNAVLGAVDLTQATSQILELPGPAEWVVGSTTTPGQWIVQLLDGRQFTVSAQGVTDIGAATTAPFELLASGEVVSAYRHHEQLTTANQDLTLLPDTRVVRGTTREGSIRLVALTDPTDRYPHAVLGDALEAGGVAIFDQCGALVSTIDVPAPDVIEEVAPLLGDIDGDGGDDIVVTISNASVGARLAAFSLDGQLLGETEPIGRGNRWRNQLAVAATGPGGEVEVIDVRTPHIGGRVQFFRLIDGRLDQVAASSDDFTTHAIRSRNLDMGIVSDVDNDAALETLVLTADRTRLIAMSRIEDGVEITFNVALPGVALSNLARHPIDPAFAIATTDGRLWIATEG